MTGADDGATRGWRAVLVTLVLFALAGAAAGAIWEWLWTPPTGIVLKQGFYLDEVGLPNAFSGTGWYCLVAGAAGVLSGVAVATAWWRSPYATLYLGGLGSLLATLLMVLVGTRLGPSDPAVLARDLPDLTRLVSDLRVETWVAYLAWPVGTLAGLLSAWGVARLVRRPGAEDEAIAATRPQPADPPDMLAP